MERRVREGERRLGAGGGRCVARSGRSLASAGLALLIVAASASAEPPVPCVGSAVAASSAAPAEASDGARLSPPTLDGPTPVQVGVYVLELRAIDEMADSYRFRGYVRVSWCDPRLAFDPVAEGRDVEVFSGEEIESQRQHIWLPAAFPVNRAGPFERSERLLHIRPDGRVTQDLNFDVLLAADYDLRRFPFDHQTLEVQVESFAWNRDQLLFLTDSTLNGVSDDFEVPEWSVLQAVGRVEEVAVRRSDVPFSRFVLAVEIERASSFYVWKVLLPLLIILALSWSIFWMTEESFATRSRVSATGVLTIVAYQFAAAGNLPRVAYLTLLDKIMIVSFGLLAVTVLQSLWVKRHQETDMERARSIDRASRWVFPLVYAASIALILLQSR